MAEIYEVLCGPDLEETYSYFTRSVKRAESLCRKEELERTMFDLGQIYLTQFEKFLIGVIEILLETIPKDKRPANPLYFSCIFRLKKIVQNFTVHYECVVNYINIVVTVPRRKYQSLYYTSRRESAYNKYY